MCSAENHSQYLFIYKKCSTIDSIPDLIWVSGSIHSVWQNRLKVYSEVCYILFIFDLTQKWMYFWFCSSFFFPTTNRPIKMQSGNQNMHYAAHCTLATHLSCCKKWLNGLLWVVCTQHIHSNANPVHFFFSFLLLFVYSFVPISFCLDLVPLWYDTSNSRQHSVVVFFYGIVMTRCLCVFDSLIYC